MAGNGKDGRSGPGDDVRDRLRQLASDIKGRTSEIDRGASHARHARIDDDPWDMASAEALTRAYEGDAEAAPTPAAVRTTALPLSGAAVKPQAIPPVYFSDSPVAAVVASPTHKSRSSQRVATTPSSVPCAQSTATPAAIPAATAPSALAMLANDRAWIDERLADLHSKVEATLSSFDPAPIVAPVNERIDRLEDHLMDVLGTIAQKADVEGFAGIEADVAVIKGHVATARDQLMRLDGIETSLKSLQALAGDSQAVGDTAPAADPIQADQRLSDIETMVRDLHAFAAEQAQAQPHVSEPPDFHGLAAKAADRAAANVVDQYKDLFAPAKRAEMAQLAAQGQAVSGPSLEDMQSLLDSYQDEQRREASQTAATLTTMQEALIRLIDRIEELAGEAPATETTTSEPSMPAAPVPQFVEVHDERTHAPGRRANDRTAAAKQISVEQALAAHHADVQQGVAARVPVQPPTVASPPPPATRQPRSGRLSEQAPAAQDADMDAAAAMAAERARVQAERNQARRLATARPQMQVAADPDEDAGASSSDDQKERKAKPAHTSKAKILGGVAALGLLMVGGAFGIQQLLVKRAVDTKLGDRIPAASAPASIPATSTAVVPPDGQPQPVPRPTGGRPHVATESLDAAPAGSPRASTPALPEAQPGAREVRPQPAGGQMLPLQPPPRELPPPQVAPQGRTVDSPPPAPRRPMPETVTDDLSSNTQHPLDQSRPTIAEAMGARVTNAAVHGIALDNSGSMPDPAELARRQSRLAPSEFTEAPSEIQTHGAVEMPPATIGPMSLRVAAQQGDPGAAFDVGVRFAEAKGVKQDFRQAVIWYSRAAQKGFVPAQYRLATIYEGGLHGGQDMPRAKVWYKRAAEQGHVKAMHNLAVIAAGTSQGQTGQGQTGQGQPDYQTAARWFAEAADRGLADSQFNLGVLHESGLGVAKDPLQAYKWFALAARSGDKEALRRRDQIMASFAPQAAQAAERLVQSWRARPTDMKANDPRAASQAYQELQVRQMQAAQQQMQAVQLRQQQQDQPAQAPVAPPVQRAPVPQAVQRTTASTSPAR